MVFLIHATICILVWFGCGFFLFDWFCLFYLFDLLACFLSWFVVDVCFYFL